MRWQPKHFKMPLGAIAFVICAVPASAQYDALLKGCMRITDAMQRNQCINTVQQQTQRAAQQQQMQQQQEQQRQQQLKMQQQMQQQQAEQQRRMQQQQQQAEQQNRLQQQQVQQQKKVQLEQQQKLQAEQQRKAQEDLRKKAALSVPKPTSPQATTPTVPAIAPPIKLPVAAAIAPTTPATITPEQKAADLKAKQEAHKLKQAENKKKSEQQLKAQAAAVAQQPALAAAAQSKSEQQIRAQEDQWLATQRANGGTAAYPGGNQGYFGAAPDEQVGCARSARELNREPNLAKRNQALQQLYSGPCRNANGAETSRGQADKYFADEKQRQAAQNKPNVQGMRIIEPDPNLVRQRDEKQRFLINALAREKAAIAANNTAEALKQANDVKSSRSALAIANEQLNNDTRVRRISELQQYATRTKMSPEEQKRQIDAINASFNWNDKTGYNAGAGAFDKQAADLETRRQAMLKAQADKERKPFEDQKKRWQAQAEEQKRVNARVKQVKDELARPGIVRVERIVYGANKCPTIIVRNDASIAVIVDVHYFGHANRGKRVDGSREGLRVGKTASAATESLTGTNPLFGYLERENVGGCYPDTWLDPQRTIVSVPRDGRPPTCWTNTACDND